MININLSSPQIVFGDIKKSNLKNVISFCQGNQDETNSRVGQQQSIIPTPHCFRLKWSNFWLVTTNCWLRHQPHLAQAPVISEKVCVCVCVPVQAAAAASTGLSWQSRLCWAPGCWESWHRHAPQGPWGPSASPHTYAPPSSHGHTPPEDICKKYGLNEFVFASEQSLNKF